MAELSAQDAYLAGREDLRQARWAAHKQLERGLIQPDQFEATLKANLLTTWQRRIDKGELPKLEVS